MTETNRAKKIRQEFPIFNQPRASKRLAYLDSAASAQKPLVVIDRLAQYMAYEHANIHRGAYHLSAAATDNYESARSKVGEFIGARSSSEIIFTRGCTEAINLVAYAIDHTINPGDTILLSLLEHHSNIVPWQMMAARKGAQVQFVNITDDARLDLADWQKKLKQYRPKIVALTSLSNAFGTVLPIGELTEDAHSYGALVLVDIAQGICHQRINLASWNVDFAAFSGHKLYGPTGIGALYVKEEHYDVLNPFQGGGGMIEVVAVEGTTWADAPRKFEAGTPAIGEAIALGATIDWLNTIEWDDLIEYEDQLLQQAIEVMQGVPGVTLYGPIQTPKEHRSIISFTASIHPHDLATIADQSGVCIRAGHHCAQPALKRLGLQATARASIGIYNDIEDFYQLAEAIKEGQRRLC